MTRNKPRAPKPTPARARATAKDRARVEALDLDEAMVDPDFAALVEHDATQDSFRATQQGDMISERIDVPVPQADRVRASSVIDFFGEAMGDLAPGHASEHYSIRATMAHGYGWGSRAQLYRLDAMARPQLIVKVLRRSVAWTRAEMGAVDVGDISAAILYSHRATWALFPLRALGVQMDRALLSAMLQSMALLEHER